LGLNYGEQYISPSAASLIIATIPVFIIILAVIFLREKLTINKTLGVVIALLGVVVISIWGKENTDLKIDYLTGVLGVFIAAILGALYTIAGKKLLSQYSGISLTLYAMLLGSIGLIPFISSSLFEEVSNLSSIGWFAVIFLGIFSTIIGYVIWYIALEIKNASDISIYLYGIPVVSTIISFFWFGHNITLFFVLGGFLVILGLYLVNVEKHKTKN
jgi:drug/metabolite transporter (DMT)-like permease